MNPLLSKLSTFYSLLKNGEIFRIARLLVENILPYKLQRTSKFEWLIDEAELGPQLEKSLDYLREHIGEKSIGDYLEFGVSHGSSLLLTYKTLQAHGLNYVKLFGFDSFEGLPQEAKYDFNGGWKPGSFYAKYRNVTKYLTEKGIDWNKVTLVKGWYKNTLTARLREQLNIRKASIIMIDCDIYSATKEALNFCKPLIRDQCIIIFDDWNCMNLAERNLGEKKAFDEFMEENPEFTSQQFGSYSFQGRQSGEVKLVSRKGLYQGKIS